MIFFGFQKKTEKKKIFLKTMEQMVVTFVKGYDDLRREDEVMKKRVSLIHRIPRSAAVLKLRHSKLFSSLNSYMRRYLAAWESVHSKE